MGGMANDHSSVVSRSELIGSNCPELLVIVPGTRLEGSSTVVLLVPDEGQTLMGCHLCQN